MTTEPDCGVCGTQNKPVEYVHRARKAGRAAGDFGHWLRAVADPWAARTMRKAGKWALIGVVLMLVESLFVGSSFVGSAIVFVCSIMFVISLAFGILAEHWPRN